MTRLRKMMQAFLSGVRIAAKSTSSRPRQFPCNWRLPRSTQKGRSFRSKAYAFSFRDQVSQQQANSSP